MATRALTPIEGSSAVTGAAFVDGEMLVRIWDSVYRYTGPGITQELYDEFMGAESKGRALQRIKEACTSCERVPTDGDE